MAKFCTKCGNKIEDGEICSCEQTQQPLGQAFQPNQGQQPSVQAFQPNQGQQPSGQAFQSNQGQAAAQNNVGIYFNRLWYVVSKTIKTPADILKQYTEASDVQVAFGFIGIQAVAFALLLAVFFGKINSIFENSIGMFSYSLSNSFEFPIAKACISALVLSIILSVVFAGILFVLTNVIFKGETDFMKMICVVGAKDLALIPFTLVALLLSLFNPIYSISVLSLGVILGYFYAAQALKGAVNIDENKSVNILFLSFAIMVIVNGIAIKTAIPTILPSITSIFR